MDAKDLIKIYQQQRQVIAQENIAQELKAKNDALEQQKWRLLQQEAQDLLQESERKLLESACDSLPEQLIYASNLMSSCNTILNNKPNNISYEIIIPKDLQDFIDNREMMRSSATEMAELMSNSKFFQPPQESINRSNQLREGYQCLCVVCEAIVASKEYAEYLRTISSDAVQQHVSIIHKFATSLDPEDLIDARAYNDSLNNAISFLRTYKQQSDRYLQSVAPVKSGSYLLIDFYRQNAQSVSVLFAELLPSNGNSDNIGKLDVIDKCRQLALLLCNSFEEYDNKCPIVNAFCSNRQESIVDVTHLPSDLVASLQYIKSHNKEINNSLKAIVNYKATIPLASYWAKQAEELIKTGNSAIATYDALPKNTIPNLAIASFVCGLCSMILSIFTGIPAIIMGHIALAKRKHNRGMGLAITGLILGYLSIVLVIIMLSIGQYLSK